MATQLPSGRELWDPVEPYLTNCLRVDAVELDLQANRSSERRNEAEVMARPDGLWQSVTIDITVGDHINPEGGTFEVRLAFTNVVLFHFGDFEFYDVFLDVQATGRSLEPGDRLYHVGALASVPGFIAFEEEFMSVAPSCLWVCTSTSPLITALSGSRPRNFEPHRLLKHYALVSDDLGTFHVVSSGVSVRRRDTSDSDRFDQ
jgi:hypothetical protein